MKIYVHVQEGSYPIYIGRGLIDHIGEKLTIKGKLFILTDDGVPSKWIDKVHDQFSEAIVYKMPHGEKNKNIDCLQEVLKKMMEAGLHRLDTLMVIGGGVPGDLGGFASSIYMRGIDFVQVPTTLLAQVDSSIGGKTAIDFNGVKNSIGSFHQPSSVWIDPDVLETLDEREVRNGLAEAVKMGMIRDPKLFTIFEKDDYMDNIDEIITRCLNIKRRIVEADEKENNSRKLLNFGHTFGHAYEAYYGLDTYLHGECVAMGMMAIMNSEELKERLKKVLERLHLPYACNPDTEEIVSLIKEDKKAEDNEITIVQVDELGKGYLKKASIDEMRDKL